MHSISRYRFVTTWMVPRAIVAIVVALSVTGPLSAVAQDDFNYNFIIADSDLVTYQTMTQLQIQLFLEHQGSYLSNYFITPDSGERIPASEYILLVSQTHRINPKFLLTMLQKEQGLIEESTPKLTQLDWAMGYGCFDNQPCNERWRGFLKQVNSAAEQFRYYYEHIGEYPYQPGRVAVIDGLSVNPQNIATAAMYNYTPHLHGNRLFSTIWEQYFLQRLPDGTLVKVSGDPTVWLLRDGQRKAFSSYLALTSRYNPAFIVTISVSDLEEYPRGFDIEFPAYSILRGTPSGTIYLLTVDRKRHISSMEVFRSLGFNPEEIEDVSDEQLARIPEGRSVTLGDAYPTGAVLESPTKDLYYVEAGRKYPLASKELAAVNYPTLKISKVSSDVLKKYATGMPIVLKDGVLVKGTGPEVYVISNGLKRHITSEYVFNAIGYRWSNIITVSDEILSLHQTGEPIVQE